VRHKLYLEPKYKILYDSDLLIRNVTEEDYSREYFCHTILRGRALVESIQIHLLSKSKGENGYQYGSIQYQMQNYFELDCSV